MEVFTLKNLDDLYTSHETQKYISDRIKTKVSDIYESPISYSFRVFDSTGRVTLAFWQWLKPSYYGKV